MTSTGQGGEAMSASSWTSSLNVVVRKDDVCAAFLWSVLLCGFLNFVWAVRNGVFCKKRREFPPGPKPLPIIGHLHLLMDLPHQALAEASSQYGHIVGLQLGTKRCVVVSSPRLAKEFLVTHDKIFANRPQYSFVSELLYGYQNDMFFSPYGAKWRRRRKICTLELFTEKRLRELEYVRAEEIAALLHKIADLSRDGTAAVDIGHCAGEMSGKIMTRLIFSRHEGTGEGESENLPELIKEMEQLTAPSIGDFVPWLSWLDRFRRPRLHSARNRMDAIMTAIINERRQAMMQNKPPQDDLLHGLLVKEMSDSSRDHDGLTIDEIKSIVEGMLGGGIHTTALALEWTMAELLKNPHCLVKAQREIDTLTGKKEQIFSSDIPNLKYLRCIVKEVFRLYPLAPLLIPRISTQECIVDKYTLPAETHLLLNVWAIGRDEQVWHNAAQFVPERFEGRDMDVRGQHFELLPFGGGRRICPGLQLGLAVVEATLANLLNRFDWELPPGITSSNMDMSIKRGISMNKATPTLAIPKLRA